RDVHADVLRLARLAEDLLVLARLDERADTGARRADLIDVGDVAATVVRRYEHAQVPVVMESPADAGPCLAVADQGGVDRVLVNLIDNAVRYAKSRVAVAVHCRDSWVELAVSDDGPGVPAADLERAFGRFTRLDPARSRDGEADGGAGLGLAIV